MPQMTLNNKKAVDWAKDGYKIGLGRIIMGNIEDLMQDFWIDYEKLHLELTDVVFIISDYDKYCLVYQKSAKPWIKQLIEAMNEKGRIEDVGEYHAMDLSEGETLGTSIHFSTNPDIFRDTKLDDEGIMQTENCHDSICFVRAEGKFGLYSVELN